MCNAINKKSLTAVCFGMVCNVSLIHAQSRNEAKFAAIDVEKERPQIENRDSLYAKYLLEGDSVSIAGMYATDGTVGCKKGDEILSSVGSWIRNNIKNDSRHVTFTTITLQADGDLLVETGKAEGRSDMGELKYTFRYLEALPRCRFIKNQKDLSLFQ